jgi:hypothetical protein
MGDALAGYFGSVLLQVMGVTAIAAIALWELGWFLWRHVGFTWS